MSQELIERLKQNEQDFEYYPTTPEIVSKVYQDIVREGNSHISILDIGAGDGCFFKKFDDLMDSNGKEMSVTKYAIERSKILLESMPDDVFVVGTNFHEQTLIDKKVDIIFCNPPYSEFKEWTVKILKEANAEYVYLVIPTRWKESLEIQRALKKRFQDEPQKIEVLGDYTFEDAERQARCQAQIVRVTLRHGESWNRHNNGLVTDPFDVWFSENFNIKAKENSYSESETAKEEARREEIKALIKGQNLIERLEELYIKDMEHLKDTYKQIERLDKSLLEEFNVNVTGIKEGLRLKINGLKAFYWQELFENFDKITEKLTSGSRKKLLDVLHAHMSVDFSSSNAYAVVLWVLKNANKYLDSQLCDIFKTLTSPENVRNYKSNKNVLSDRWRFINNKDSFSHYVLEYRIIHDIYNIFNASTFGNYEYENGISREVNSFLNDLGTIGKNLQFNVISDSFSFKWLPGQEKVFLYTKETAVLEFMRVRAYKKGSLHIKFNQEFMKKLNIEAARLNGWLKSPEYMSQETGLDINEVKDFVFSNKKILRSQVSLLH
jgi:hypothetical protein